MYVCMYVYVYTDGEMYRSVDGDMERLVRGMGGNGLGWMYSNKDEAREVRDHTVLDGYCIVEMSCVYSNLCILYIDRKNAIQGKVFKNSLEIDGVRRKA